ADDLARGSSVRFINDHTVAVVPRDLDFAETEDDRPPEYLCTHLVFAEDGRLAERQLIYMPAKETLARETYGIDGTVKLFDGTARGRASPKLALAAASAPDLEPDLKKLVVLPLPLRTREHVRQALRMDAQGRRFDDVTEQEALSLFAADYATQNNNEANQIFH